MPYTTTTVEQHRSKTLFSTDSWYDLVVQNFQKANEEDASASQQIYESLGIERPSVVSAVMERACNLQCRHCLYQYENTSAPLSRERQLPSIIANIVSQLPAEQDGPRHERPAFIHEGRILQPWHLEVFEQVRHIRPDCQLGLIDNGTFVKYLHDFSNKQIQLDWIDISLDGLEKAHNEQRDHQNGKAWAQAIEGLIQARHVTRPVRNGGKVTALMTITSLNHADVANLAEIVFSPHPEVRDLPLASEFHVTPMVPYLTANHHIDTTILQFERVWRQIREVWQEYNTDHQQRFFVKFYNVQDWLKLGEVVGFGHLWRALTDTESEHHVSVDIGSFTCTIDSVRVSYFPTSLWPQESFLIDADGANRVATSQQYRLDQLHTDPNLGKFTVGQLQHDDDFSECYRRELSHWWQHFGKRLLQQEAAVMRAICLRS